MLNFDGYINNENLKSELSHYFFHVKYFSECSGASFYGKILSFCIQKNHLLSRYITWENKEIGKRQSIPLTTNWIRLSCCSPSPSHSSSTGEGLTAADHGDSDLSGVDRSNVVASAGQTEDRIGSNSPASSRGLPQVWQGKQRGAPQFGSTLCFSDQQKDI